MRMISKLNELLEWRLLFRFLRQSPVRAVLFIVASLSADVLAIAVPIIVLLAISFHTGTAAPGGEIGAFLSQYADPLIALPAAFFILLTQQSLRFASQVLLRRIDRMFFVVESFDIYERYKNTPLYLEDLSDKMRPMWFSKNIARNVRHTSEAMQGQFSMVPQLITMFISICALYMINPMVGLVVLPIGLIAGLALAPGSRRIFEHSRQHFEDRLPAFAKDLSVQLNQVYREPSDTELPPNLPTSFGSFLDSRYRLHTMRAGYRAFSAIVLGALFLIVVLTSLLASTAVESADITQVGVLVILLILLMNKAAAVVGNVGGLLTLYPQIKMSREIEANLNKSHEVWLTRLPKENTELWTKLPFLTQVAINGQFTRFNLIKLLEIIEARIEAGDQTLPMSEIAFIRNSSLDRHLEGVNIDSDRANRVMYMLKRLRKSGKRIVILDWSTLNEMTASNIAHLSKNYRNLRIIVPTMAKIPKRWKDTLGKSYEFIDDIDVLTHAVDVNIADDFADD